MEDVRHAATARSVQLAKGQPLLLLGDTRLGGEGELRLVVTLHSPTSMVEELVTGEQCRISAFSEVVLPWHVPESGAVEAVVAGARWVQLGLPALIKALEELKPLPASSFEKFRVAKTAAK